MYNSRKCFEYSLLSKIYRNYHLTTMIIDKALDIQIDVTRGTDGISSIRTYFQPRSPLNKWYNIFELNAHVFFLLQQCSYKLSKMYGEHQKKLYLHFYFSKSFFFFRII